MKKVKSLLTVIALGTALVLTGCSGGQTTPATAVKDPAPAAEGKYKDGLYYAQEDAFAASGWKNVVTLEVKDGKIASAEWNAVNAKGGPDKITFSSSGQYGMKAGGASAEWHEQSKLVEDYLIKTQDPSKITYKDKDGHTDDIAGVTIKVPYFFDTAKKALDAGPIEKGPYKDGAYYAEEPVYAKSGWKNTVSMTVLNGNIVAVDWNGLNLNGGKDKDTFSADGEYGMKAGGASAEWHEQAAKAEAYLLKVQDPSKITLKDAEGHTDDIAGVTIKVPYFVDQAKAALDKGPIPQGNYKDGNYYAADEAFDKGWKYMVSLVVKNGTIVGADWNGIPEDATKLNKDLQAADGTYKLAPGNQGEWNVQAAKAEAHLLKTQDPAKITLKNAEGNTDDIAGVTIKVGNFVELATKALAGTK